MNKGVERIVIHKEQLEKSPANLYTRVALAANNMGLSGAVLEDTHYECRFDGSILIKLYWKREEDGPSS